MTEKQLKIMNILLLNIVSQLAIHNTSIYELTDDENYKDLVKLVHRNCGDVENDL